MFVPYITSILDAQFKQHLYNLTYQFSYPAADAVQLTKATDFATPKYGSNINLSLIQD